MSISTEITKLNTNLTNSYTACSNKGATLPASQNFDNLASTISAIPAGTTPTLITKTITANGTYAASSDNADGFSSVSVNVAGTTPTGTYTITANGTYDVTNYASANVNVSGGSGSITPAPYNCTKEYLGDLTFRKGAQTGGVALGVEEIYISAGRFCASVSVDSSQYTSDFLIPVFQYGSTGSGSSTSTFLNPAVTGANDDGYSKMFINARDDMSFVSGGIIRKLYREPSNCPAVLNFAAITTLTMTSACQNAINLEKVLFPNATSLSLKSCFKGCTSLHTFYAPKLNTLPSQALGGTSSTGGTFSGCTSLTTLSFPSLTSTSFGSYTNQFDNMLKGVTGCTVHFPSNLQSVIGSWASVTGGFAGTNTTVLFDLPATT